MQQPLNIEAQCGRCGAPNRNVIHERHTNHDILQPLRHTTAVAVFGAIGVRAAKDAYHPAP